MPSQPRYENPTFARELTDFPIDNNTASFAVRRGIVNMEGYDRIGRPTGSVVELATGYQSLHLLPPNEIVTMRLYGSAKYGVTGAQNHFTYEYGEVTEGTKVMIDHNCQAGHLDIDCGCRHSTQHALHEVFGEGHEDGLYLNIDGGDLSKSERIEIARDMLEATGGSVSRYIQSTPGFDNGCELNEMIVRQNKKLGSFQAPSGREFHWTNDLPVSFLGGHPGRLIVIKEEATTDKSGFGGKQKIHQVLIHGDVTNPERPAVVRPHSSCTTAEYGGNACDCADQEARTLRGIVENEAGLFLLMEDEGMGTGFANKLWQTQQTIIGETDLLTSRERFLGLPGDIRSYEMLEFVAQIAGMETCLHASNNHTKQSALENAGIQVVGHMALKVDGGRFSPHAKADFIAKQRSGNYSNYLNY